jgi:DMSO reductase family type II enzyme chaperone
MPLDRPPGADREVDLALCRSLLYGAISLGFLPPNAETRRRLGRADALEPLARAASVLDAESGTQLASRLRTLATGPAAERPEEWSATYRRLFGHTARGRVPPYETEYGDDTLFQKPQELADLAGFLGAFGLAVDPSAHERIDHVSCELEFLAFLCRKEAHALECGDDPMWLETRRAVRLFLSDHLARFVPSFTRRVQREDADGFYGRLAALCQELVRSECARLEATLGPGTLRLRVASDDGAPMACGVDEACAQGACPAASASPAGSSSPGSGLLLQIGPRPSERDGRG